MSRAAFKSVDEYMAAQPEEVRTIPGQVRSAIRKARPRAEEVISYKIPAYKMKDGIVLYFAGWKQHYALYPGGERLVAAFKDELVPYRVTKGTIRFPLLQPVPVKLIGRIARFRAQEAAARRQEKAIKKTLSRKH